MKYPLKSLTIVIASLFAAQSNSVPVLSTDDVKVSQLSELSANAWIEVDVQAFENNIAELQKLLNGKSKVCAILKADAYGHGINLLMPSIIKMNVPCIGIASNEEARIARAHNYEGTIMRVRAASINEIKDGLKYDMEELVGDVTQAQTINALAKEAGKDVRIHISLNSAGMDRNGIDMSTDNGRAEALELTKFSNLKVVGIMTHYPEENEEIIRKDLVRFNEDSKWLIENAGLNRNQIVIHTANSYTTLTVPEAHFDMVRPGGLLYGDSIPTRTEYKRILSFKSRVANINHYPKGSTVGYDRTFKLERDSMLANLPFGYSDGYRRIFSNKGYVLINGHKVPVVGRVSMNTTMVDVTDFPDILEGAEVVIFGTQGDAKVEQADIEEINGALLADLYTVWGNSNPRIAKPTTTN
ncbi:alanine racemase [Taylorella equigenitalis]|uniref:alanine racemase n=1 Tax=Taylorella equigenitalis TaxID=29575 RepID=UPI000423A4DC|nr:alanine racemase [Taylorella equigenitalis]WDU45813.1 alanine racemase [Taylorella equigenitalis]